MQDPVSARTKVAVVGLGGIGGVAAACLQESGRHDVIGCARRPMDRLTLERPDYTVELPMRILTEPSKATPVDWVILATKTHEVASAAAWLTQLCQPSTRVAILQNGIGHAARIAPYASGATAVPVVVYYNGERLAPDRVRLRHVGDMDLAVAHDAAGSAFRQLLDGTPLKVHLDADFTTLQWRKLLMNAVANPITALTRQRQAVLRHADVRTLSMGVLEEAAAVGRAEGANLPADAAEQMLTMMFTYSGELGTSMYFDVLASRPLEIEALTGAIVSAGERNGIPTPLNRVLLSLLRAVSEANTPGS